MNELWKRDAFTDVRAALKAPSFFICGDIFVIVSVLSYIREEEAEKRMRERAKCFLVTQ